MAIALSQKENALTVTLTGDIDHHSARSMMLALDREVASRSPRRLTLDLSGVTFMDSSGIAVVLRAHRRMEEAGGAVELRNVPKQARKVFSAAGLDRIVSMT